MFKSSKRVDKNFNRVRRKLHLLFFSLSFLLATQASALTISPGKGLITVDRNSSQSVVVTVFNETEKLLNLEPKVLGMQQGQDGGPLFDLGISQAEKWISTNQGDFVLSPNESKKINFNIDVPDGIYPGSYYLGLAVKSSNKESGGTGISSQVVSLLTIQVAGLAEENLKITKWEVEKSFLTKLNWDFDLKFRNLGNVEVPLLGSVEVYSWKGKKILEKDVYLGNQLLVDSIRNVKPDLNLSEYKFLLPGIYKSKILINYGKTNQLVEKEVRVLYLPVWSFVVLGFGFLFIILIIFKIKYLRKRK